MSPAHLLFRWHWVLNSAGHPLCHHHWLRCPQCDCGGSSAAASAVAGITAAAPSAAAAAMAAGSERYMTCPELGDRVLIAEDVSRSLEPGAYLDSMLVTEPELEEEYRLSVDATDRQPAATGSSQLLDSCRSRNSAEVSAEMQGEWKWRSGKRWNSLDSWDQGGPFCSTGEKVWHALAHVIVWEILLTSPSVPRDFYIQFHSKICELTMHVI